MKKGTVALLSAGIGFCVGFGIASYKVYKLEDQINTLKFANDKLSKFDDLNDYDKIDFSTRPPTHIDLGNINSQKVFVKAEKNKQQEFFNPKSTKQETNTDEI